MAVPRFVTFFICICLLINAATAQGVKTGKWSGWIKQGETPYSYTLLVNKVVGDSLFGTSTSRSKDFFCETKFRAVQQKGKWLVSETAIIRTNYTGVGTVCLMQLSLTKSGERLQGTFTSSSKELKDCGSGTVALQFIPETAAKNSSLDTGIKAHQPEPKRQLTPVAAVKEKKEAVPVMLEKKSPVAPDRLLEKRDLELINTFSFDEDSIMIRLYDNGVIDGDIISLVINGKIMLDKVKLTARSIELPLKAINTENFQVELFAENLGDIPPNTGLVVLSGSEKQTEVVFSSDLKKTSAFRVILKKKN